MRGQLCPSKWCLGFPDFGDFCLVVVVMNTSQVNCSLFTVCDDQTLHGGDDPRLPHRHAWLSDSFRKLEGKNLGEVPALHKTQRTVHTHTDREKWQVHTVTTVFPHRRFQACISPSSPQSYVADPRLSPNIILGQAATTQREKPWADVRFLQLAAPLP